MPRVMATKMMNMMTACQLTGTSAGGGPGRDIRGEGQSGSEQSRPKPPNAERQS